MDSRRFTAAHFQLVTAGHHFLLDVLPFRQPDSRYALDRFVRTAKESALTSAEIDAILVRCLAVLNEHTGGRLPSLIDRYISAHIPSVDDCLRRFRRCIEDVLTYRGVGNPVVQEAIAIITTRYGDPALTPRSLAEALGQRLSNFCMAFKRVTGTTPGLYLRNVRLDIAANLLVTTSQSIKEVWVQVGFNHPSNFVHAFRERFDLTPTEYRRRSIRGAAADRERTKVNQMPGDSSHVNPRVLIIDDDEGTRETLAIFLEREGSRTVTAPTGAEGLRYLTQTSPQVVLLDYHLPDMTGADVLHAMRERQLHKFPAVAVFTADWEVGLREREFEELGAIVTSKLCDLEAVKQLILYLTN